MTTNEKPPFTKLSTAVGMALTDVASASEEVADAERDLAHVRNRLANANNRLNSAREELFEHYPELLPTPGPKQGLSASELEIGGDGNGPDA